MKSIMLVGGVSRFRCRVCVGVSAGVYIHPVWLSFGGWNKNSEPCN